ncbi:MAG TPA: hypothetical protein PLY70_06635, partial [Saprospiraceae bacterium]|nr:hypothetical protein [Saprospiraceae bacterium]
MKYPFVIVILSLFTSVNLKAQASINPSDAVPICGHGFYEIGLPKTNFTDIADFNCFPQDAIFDHYEVILIQGITKGGTININFMPAGEEDVDFIAYKLDGRNLTPLRCMASGKTFGNETATCLGMTGLSEGSEDLVEFEGCDGGNDNFVKNLDAEIGDKFIILVTNYKSGNSVPMEMYGTAEFDMPNIILEDSLEFCKDFNFTIKLPANNKFAYNWEVSQNPVDQFSPLNSSFGNRFVLPTNQIGEKYYRVKVSLIGSSCKESTSNVSVVKTIDCPQCNDGIKNGSETDIDCGGKECPSCTGCELITNLVLNDTIVNCEGEWTDTVQLLANYCNVIYEGNFSMEIKGDDCLSEIIKTWTFELPDSIAAVRQVITVDKKPVINNINLAANFQVQCDYYIPSPPVLSYINKCSKDTIYPVFSENLRTGDNLPPRLLRKWVFPTPCGDSLVINQSILIFYNQGIKIPAIPGNILLTCEDETPSAPNLSVQVDCNTSIAPKFTEVLSGNGCTEIITRTYTFSLPNAQDTSLAYTITKIDTVAPIPELIPTNLKFLCLTDTTDRPIILAKDNCTPGSINPIYSFNNNGGLGTEESPLIFKRNWIFKDLCGNSSEVSQEITVQNSAEILLPEVPKDTLVSCLSEIPDTANLIAAAGCGVSINGQFSEQRIGNACDMTIIRTWNFSYLDLNPKTLIQTIKVLNQFKPQYVVPNDSTIACGTDLNPDLLGYPSNIIVGCGIGRDVFYKDVFAEKSDCPGSGLITRSWHIKDQCGNESIQKQFITTLDTSAPQLIEPVENVSIACRADVPTAPELFAIDLCTGEKIKGLFSQTDNGGEAIPSNHLVISRNWYFIDKCGNDQTTRQTITVTGSTDVTYPEAPSAYTVACLDEVGAMEDLVATNGCENRAEGLKNELRTGDSCQMQIMRTWTFSFPDIPTKTISQTITISNKKTPDFKVPDNLTISCDENRTLEVLGEVGEITTYCNIGTESSFIDGPINEICKGTGSWNRIWKVTDVCGNTAVKTQIISIEDKIAPIPPSPEEDLVFNCRSEITNPLDLIAVDNCFEGEIHGMLTTINNEGLGTITNPFILNRKWTFTDNCGNVSETFQKVTVSDDSEIQLPSPPQNFTIHCLDELGKEETLIASDYCNDSIIGIFNEERIGDLCNMTIIRTWTFSDFDKEVKTIRQEIALINNIEPDFLAPENVELICGVYESNGIYGEPTMIDVNCNNSFQITYQDGQLNKICGNAGTVIREWKVLDQCANETSKSQTINIIDVSPPIPQNIPEDQILSCLSELELPVLQNAIDECSGELIAASPQFSDNAGLGIASNPLIRTINWSFTDACGNTAIAEQIITVAGTTENIYDVAPAQVTVQCVGDIPPPDVLNGRNACGTQAKVIFNELETGDNCFKIITRSWTFKLPDQIDHVETQVITLKNEFIPQFDLPANVSIACESYDGNIEFGTMTNISTGCNASYTISFSDSGDFNASCKDGIEIQRAWTLTDNCGNTNMDFQIISLTDNQAPEAPDAEANLTFNCFDEISNPIDLFAIDNCANNPIQGILSTSDDANYGTVFSPRNILRTWTFTDACGIASTANQLITISDNSEINLPASPDDYTIKCIEDLLGAETLFATDACSDSIMGDLVVNEVGDDCNKVITRTWTFTNLDKSPKTIVQTVTLDNNELPTFIVPEGLSLQCGEYDENTEYGVPRNVEVNCNNTYDITYLDVVTNFGCGGTKTISRRWKVLDNCSNEMEQEQLIEIIDTQAPIPQNIPNDITFECMSDLTDYENQMAIDDCTGDQIISIPNISQNDGNGNLGNPFIQTRTWIFTDSCGNSSEAVQTASVIGTSENYYEPAPSDVLVSCDSLVEQEVTLVGNNICDVNATVTFNEIESGNDCDKTITRTWDFDLPNQTTHREIQNIRILKNVPPSIQAPEPQTIDCDIYNSAEQYGADPIVNTYCDLSYTLSFSDVGNLNVACLDGVAITRTWIATDACGNTATSEQILTLKDETGPLISSVGPDVIGKCENDVPDVKFSQIVFTDNCRSSFYEFDYRDLKTNLSPYSTCEDHFLLERKYFVFDACGNSSNMIQNILIEDTEYPEFAEFPDNVTVSCDIPQSTGAEILVTDNCPTFSYGGYSVSDRYITNTTCLIEIERFYETADNCGNRLSRVQLITVKDETGPSFSGSLLDDSFKCIGDIPSPTELGIVVEDECDEMVNFTVNETSESYICDDKLTVKRTYTSTDQCNNTTTVDQYFYIDNDIKPSIISIFPDTYVEFGNPVPELTESDIEAAYGCATQNGFPDPKLGLTFFIDQDSIPGRCDNNYTIERNISVTDACGNNSEVIYQILVDDTEAPYISRSPGDVLAECSDDPSIIYDFNQYTVTDVASVSHSYVEHVNYNNCIN